MLTKGGEKKNSHSPNMWILGKFLSCQVARTKSQEEAKMLSNLWKVNKSTISIRIKKGLEDAFFFSFPTTKTWFIWPNTLEIRLYEFLFCHFILNDYVSGKTEQQLKERRAMAFISYKQKVFSRLYYFSFFFHIRNR